MSEPKFVGYMWENPDGSKAWGKKPKPDDEIILLLEKMITFELSLNKTLNTIETAMDLIIKLLQQAPPPPPPKPNPATRIIFTYKLIKPGA